VAVATAANNAHPSTECSNKGICDRKTGECECFDNYEGMACERTVCPANWYAKNTIVTRRKRAASNSLSLSHPSSPPPLPSRPAATAAACA
jgi:hypothetical protein